MFGIFTPILGEDSHFHEYLSNGLKPPTSFSVVELGIQDSDMIEEERGFETRWRNDIGGNI